VAKRFGKTCLLAGLIGGLIFGLGGELAAEPLQANSGPDKNAADEASIRAIRMGSNEAIARHDVEAIVASIDSEYQITTGAGVFYRGGPDEELRAWSEHFAEYDDVVYVRTTESVELSTWLPIAAESGNWTGSYRTENGIRNLNGRYLASWRKVNGDWKIRSELFVTLACEGPGC
jgi:ketosteroid isomerase-like protein